MMTRKQWIIAWLVFDVGTDIAFYGWLWWWSVQ